MSAKCPDRDRLLLYLEGGLCDAEAVEVERHVTGCGVCGAELRELRELTGALKRAGAVRDPSRRVSSGGHEGVARGEPCPGAAVLAGYADGSLDSMDEALVESHLARCASCREEVADLWSLAGPADRDAPTRAVEAAIARLDRESRTAVVRWAERSLVLVRDFATSMAGALGERNAPSLVPAPAVARSTARDVRVHWEGRGGIRVDGLVRTDSSGVSLTGRVTVEDTAAVTTSVSLLAGERARGPESTDVDGCFGPWPLSMGENVLRLTGLPEANAKPMELVIRVDGAAP